MLTWPWSLWVDFYVKIMSYLKMPACSVRVNVSCSRLAVIDDIWHTPAHGHFNARDFKTKAMWYLKMTPDTKRLPKTIGKSHVRPPLTVGNRGQVKVRYNWQRYSIFQNFSTGWLKGNLLYICENFFLETRYLLLDPLTDFHVQYTIRKLDKWRSVLATWEVGFRTGTPLKPGLKFKFVGFFDIFESFGSCDPSFNSKICSENESDAK